MDLGYKMPKSVRANGKPDGHYGFETVKAVEGFQTQQKIRADGVAWASTLNRLDQVMLARMKPAKPVIKYQRPPLPYSAVFVEGSADPPLKQDPGSGPWKSTPKSMVVAAQAAGIVSILPIAAVTIGDDAAKHLFHYFLNSGTPYTIDLEGMVDEVPSAWDL